jgi:hypothetical protein
MPRRNKVKSKKNKSKTKRRSFFKFFSGKKKKSSKGKSSKGKSSKGKSSKGKSSRGKSSKGKSSRSKSSKGKSAKGKSSINNIVFTVSERKPNPNKNTIIHQRSIPNSPLLQLQSLLMETPNKTYNSNDKKGHKSNISAKSSMHPYPSYLDDLLDKPQQPHRLSPNIFMLPSSNSSYQQEIVEAPQNYKRVESSTFTSQHIDGNISKSGVKVITDSRKPKSDLFTLQNNHVTHEMVNHNKVKERVKRATKKMALLKKREHFIKSKKSKKSKVKKSKKRPFVIQSCSDINL